MEKISIISKNLFKGMNVLVTGGGGFLGRHIIELLKDSGVNNIKSIGRHAQPRLKECGIETIEGDLRNYNTTEEACKNIDLIFHTAAKTGIWGKWKDFYEINYKGTENIVNACKKQKVPFLVYTSSPSIAYSPYKNAENINEKALMPNNYAAFYPATKRLAEDFVLKNNSKDLKTLSLRPHLLWGVGDPHLLPRIIRRANKKKLFIIGSGKNVVDLTCVKNAAYAHILAAHTLIKNHKPEGKAYFISDGQPVKLWDWINNLLSKCNLPPATKKIPFWSAYLAGIICECIYIASGIKGEPPITRFTAGQLAFSHYFNINAAKNDFNYTLLVNPSTELKLTVEWIKEELIKV